MFTCSYTCSGDIEAAALQVARVTRTREEEVTGDAGDDDAAEAEGASSTHTQPGGHEAAGTPRGPEMKGNVSGGTNFQSDG